MYLGYLLAIQHKKCHYLKGCKKTPNQYKQVKKEKMYNSKPELQIQKMGQISMFIITVNHIFPTAPIKFISRNVCSSFIFWTKVKGKKKKGGKKEREDKDFLHGEQRR